jgi:N-acetylglucosamine kinase-like BadF-type ATPase
VEQVRAELEVYQLARDLVIENDGFISLYAGTLGGPGVAVISGTGSISVGINREKKRARAGGWGHLLGDEGSGYDIARQAIMAVLRAHDGRGPATSFATALLNQFGVQTPEGLIDLFYRQGIGKETVAAAAPIIIDAADKDAVAANIIHNAIRELVMLAATTRRQLELTLLEPTVVSGGLFKDQRIYDSFIHCSALVCPGVQVIKLPWESALGAVFLALRQAGVEVGWDTARRLAYEMEVRKG